MSQETQMQDYIYSFNANHINWRQKAHLAGWNARSFLVSETNHHKTGTILDKAHNKPVYVLESYSAMRSESLHGLP